MKKIWTIFAVVYAMVFFLAGCDGLKTPEELIGPPEVDLDKKKINDRIQAFVPANAELLVIPQGRNSKNSDSVHQSNFDEDEDLEIIALYRDKNERKIGMLIADQNAATWYKKFEMNIDAFEISDYIVTDLDNDGIKEIVLGYFSIKDPYKELMILGYVNGSIQKIHEMKYLALDLNNIGKENTVEMAISTEGNDNSNNKFVILNYKNNIIQKTGEMIYPEGTEIYKILYGKMNSTQKAYFVDMYVDESTGRTDIVSLVDQDLTSIIRENNISDITQEIPMASTDTNGDGIIEVISNKILEQDQGIAALVINLCYNINMNDELILLSKVYSDYEMNIQISFPVVTNADIFVRKSGDHLKFYYRSKKLTREIEFLDIIKRTKQSLGENERNYLQVADRYDEVILARLKSDSSLTGAEKNEFDKMYDSITNLSDIIRFIE